MEMTRANLDRVFTGFKLDFNKGLSMADKSWEKWCASLPSSGSAAEYPMMMLTGGMRKWIGDMIFNKITGNSMTVYNDDYANGVDVNRNHIADDNLGIYSPQLVDMGINAENLWPNLAIAALLANGAWADGKAFFAANHKFGKATINNLMTNAASQSAFNTMRTRMMKFKDATGNPIGLIMTHVMYGPDLEPTFDQILKAQIVSVDSVGVSNTTLNKAEGILNPFITGSQWFGMCLSRGVKPAAVQKRKVGALERLDSDNSDHVVKTNHNLYKIHYRGAAVCGVPQLIIGSFPQ